jgi:hypothetical protein
VSARANIAPKWSGVVTAEGVLKLDARGLFFSHLKRLANQPIELVIRKLARPKSTSQLGYLFGIVYPVIGETYCDTDYDPDALHDALMRKLRGLKPEPNPLQMRETLRDKDHEYVSDYISDLRLWALDQGIVTPDATKAEARPVRVSKAA